MELVLQLSPLSGLASSQAVSGDFGGSRLAFAFALSTLELFDFALGVFHVSFVNPLVVL